MAKEGAQEVRTALHRQSRTPSAMGESVQVEGGIVRQWVGFEPGPEVFDGIEFGGVRGQVPQVSRAGQNTLVDQLALVRLEAVPDQHDGPVQLSLQMREEVHRALDVPPILSSGRI